MLFRSEDEPHHERDDEGGELHGDEDDGDEDVGDEGGGGIEVGDTVTLVSSASATRVRTAKASVYTWPPFTARKVGHGEVQVAGTSSLSGKLCWGWLRTERIKKDAAS